MKKVYEKPQMTYENFELSTSISASCDYPCNAQPYMCSVYDPIFEKYLFSSETCVSGAYPGKYDQPCYDVIMSELGVFSS